MKAPTLQTLTLSDRLAALTQRERILLTVGVAALLLFLLYMLFWRGDVEEQAPVELAVSPPAALAPAPVPQIAMAAPPLPVAPAAPAGAISAMTLQGVSGGGPGGGAALIQDQSGSQRLVRVGREIAPGVVLKSVGLSHAIVGSGGGDLRMHLNRPGATAVVGAVGPARATVPPPVRAERAETLGLRLGLMPRQVDGRVSGYTVRPGAGVSRLAQAGLQAGDIITRVNGSELDEERLLELSSQMSNSTRMDLEVVRGGKTMRLTFVPQQLR